MLFIFTKFVALTCVFCLGVAILMDVVVILAVQFTAVGISYVRWNWLILWGLVWLGSFLLAWHLLIVPHLDRAPKG